jgi:hypothetical protein
MMLAFVASSFLYAGSLFLATYVRDINFRFISAVLMGIITMYGLESTLAV